LIDVTSFGSVASIALLGGNTMRAFSRTYLVAALALLAISPNSCSNSSRSGIQKVSPMPPLTRVTEGPGYYFFGYYGIDPWSASEKYIVCMRVPFQDRIPAADDTAQICLVELASGKIIPVAQTVAWNFQQGAMLHWMPTSPDTLIIYNDRTEEGFVSFIVNVFSGERRELPLPIAALSHNGKYATSVDFARLFKMRAGYGYAGGETAGDGEAKDESKDGLFLLNTEDGSHRLIVSNEKVDEFLGGLAESTGSPIWINHTAFNTDDSRIFFLARIMKKTRTWYTASLTVSCDGSDMRMVVPTEWGSSHFDWESPDKIFVTTMYQGGKNVDYVIASDGGQEYKIIAEGVLTRDGHGSFSPDRRWMVSDTYPDKKHMRSLLLINLETEEVFELGRFYSNPKLQGEIRCDLHPRWNHDGTKICFDSMHEGPRGVYVMDVSKIVRP
jgi:hypothetical protein